MLYTKVMTANGVEVREATADEIRAECANLVQAKVLDDFVTREEFAIDLLKTILSGCRQERFIVLFLNTAHAYIGWEEMCRGTIDAASVYPREVVRRALELDAKAVILGHNHPSGNTTPSIADERITRVIKDACALLDINVLDHIIVSDTDHYGFASHGRI